MNDTRREKYASYIKGVLTGVYGGYIPGDMPTFDKLLELIDADPENREPIIAAAQAVGKALAQEEADRRSEVKLLKRKLEVKLDSEAKLPQLQKELAEVEGRLKELDDRIDEERKNGAKNAEELSTKLEAEVKRVKELFEKNTALEAQLTEANSTIETLNKKVVDLEQAAAVVSVETEEEEHSPKRHSLTKKK